MDIIFDIGKVLIDFDFDEYVQDLLPEESAAAVADATWHNPDWAELDRGALPLEEVLQKFISKAPGHEWEIRRVFSKLGDIPRLKDTTIPMIQELRSRGHRVFYLSNYFEFLMHAAPEVLRFTRCMDGGIFSWYEKVIKPDAEIYRRLLERYGIQKDNCVFIDDSPKNIKAAEALGIRAILYTGQTPDQLYGEIGIE